MIVKHRTSRGHGAGHHPDIPCLNTYGPESSAHYPSSSYPVSPWLDEAACRQPGAPDMTADTTSERALLEKISTCVRCPVYDECHADLIEQNPWTIVGVWAGITNPEWQELRRRAKEDT